MARRARVRLHRQPSRLLDLLVAKAGDVVSREEIRAALWGDDTHVDFERSLNLCVAKRRAALGNNAAAPAFIETVQVSGGRAQGLIVQDGPVVVRGLRQ